MLPSLVLENQFGEVSNNFVKGGGGLLSCSFVVDVANVNGLGLKSFKGLGIAAAFMHTSATPLAGNPNPASGYIQVKFADGFAGYLAGSQSFGAPLSGSSINVTTGVTAGLAYVITAVGTTTAAQWQILGLPANVVPAVGQAFIAIASTTATGTGTIQVQAAVGSGLDHIESLGDPGASANTSDGLGGTAVLVILSATSSSVTTLKVATPPDGTEISLQFVMTAQPGPLV